MWFVPTPYKSGYTSTKETIFFAEARSSRTRNTGWIVDNKQLSRYPIKPLALTLTLAIVIAIAIATTLQRHTQKPLFSTAIPSFLIITDKETAGPFFAMLPFSHRRYAAHFCTAQGKRHDGRSRRGAK